MAISKKRSFAVADDMVFNIDKSPEPAVAKETSIKKEKEPAVEPVAIEIVQEPIKKEVKVAKTVGRPKGDMKKAVTIYIPIDTYDDMNNGPIPLLRGKVSEYIVSLIEADLKENEDTYKKISNVLTATRGK